MIYDFYQQQNAKKSGAVHVTYLLSGTVSVQKENGSNGSSQENGESMKMRSSPFMSSSMLRDEEEATIQTMKVITLVREEHLEG